MKKVLGIIILSVPFIGIAVFVFAQFGLEGVVIVFSSAAIIFGSIFAGVELISS